MVDNEQDKLADDGLMVGSGRNDAGDDEVYKPRNAIVAAKEHLYSRVNVSVRQIDMLIFACIALILVLIVVGAIL